MTHQDAARGDRAARVQVKSQDRLTRSPVTSYTGPAVKVNRVRPAKLSRTAAPPTGRDLNLWPDWCDVPVESLDLDRFDAAGNPLAAERGV
jgi:hypothetical protein